MQKVDAKYIFVEDFKATTKIFPLINIHLMENPHLLMLLRK